MILLFADTTLGRIGETDAVFFFLLFFFLLPLEEMEPPRWVVVTYWTLGVIVLLTALVCGLLKIWGVN